MTLPATIESSRMPADVATAIEDPATAPSRLPRIVRMLSWLLIVVAILVAISALPVGPVLERLSAWIESLGYFGYIVYVVIYVIGVVLMLPGLILTMAAGPIFGVVEGTILVSVASTTGVALTFLISRYLLRDRVARQLKENRKAAAIDQAIGERGWKIVLLLRLSPAVPFNLQNYLYGVTSVHFWQCVMASWIGMLPGTLMYVYLGDAAGSVAALAAGGQGGETTAGQWVLRSVGLLATIAVTVYVTRIATKAVKQYTDVDEDGPVESAGDDSAPPVKGWTLGTIMTALLAVVLLTGAVWAKANERAAPVEAYGGQPAGLVFDHSEFNNVVKMYVDDHGWVDYTALAKDTSTLDAYIAAVGAAAYDELGRDDKLALLINAYNAFTLRLIIDHWNDGNLESIKDIPDSLRWEDRRWNIGDMTLSLDNIEHDEIRPKFKEPRIHFALVCAAVSCPKLRNEAYVAARLEEQLEDQARYTHAHGRWYRYDADENRLYLTSLYDPFWYGGDFDHHAGSVLKYVANYSDEVKAALDAGKPPRVSYIEYDWKLNRMENRE